MTKLYFCLLLLLVGCTSSQEEVSTPHYLVFQNIQVVDVIGGTLSLPQTVVIKDSLLYFMGTDWSEAPSANMEWVDGSDQYLIPGLWDMHFHLCWETANDSLLFQPLLQTGITGIRDMGGDLAILNQFKQTILRDPSKGPQIIGAGPIIDGNPPVMYDFSLAIDEDSEIENLLDSLRKNGVDFFKTYSLIRETELNAIAAYAQLHQLPFAGHLSEYVEPEHAIALGQKSIEHLNRLDDIWLKDPKRLEAIAQAMKTQKTWLCPTLLIYYLKAHLNEDAIVQKDYDAYVHPILQAEWQQSRNRRLSANDSLQWQQQRSLLEEQKQLVSFFHRAGIPLLAGSDFGGMPYAYPGIGLHQELQLLQEAGLSPAEALATATINPARYFEMEDRYGSIRTGNYADLIVLAENPLADVANTMSIRQVYRQGKRVR